MDRRDRRGRLRQESPRRCRSSSTSWHPWCGPCRMVSPVVEQMGREFAGRLRSSSSTSTRPRDRGALGVQAPAADRHQGGEGRPRRRRGACRALREVLERHVPAAAAPAGLRARTADRRRSNSWHVNIRRTRSCNQVERPRLSLARRGCLRHALSQTWSCRLAARFRRRHARAALPARSRSARRPRSAQPARGPGATDRLSGRELRLPYLSVSQIGQRGNGVLRFPQTVAVGPDGSVYVGDQSSNVVQVFGPDGAFVREVGIAGARPGQLGSVGAIAVAPDNTLYVADGSNRIDRYGPSGQFIGSFGVAAPRSAIYSERAGHEPARAAGWRAVAACLRPDSGNERLALPADAAGHRDRRARTARLPARAGGRAYGCSSPTTSTTAWSSRHGGRSCAHGGGSGEGRGR